MNNHFSDKVSVFQTNPLPESNVHLAGYAALIHVYKLETPLPDTLCAISHKHQRYEHNNWRMFTPRHLPQETLIGHLTFALKYEGISLFVLKVLFDTVKPADIIQIVTNEPTGTYSRRIWFLYEWLLDVSLTIPDAKTGNFINVLDPKLQYAGPTRTSKRHRVHNNLPGVRDFCPLIRKTPALEHYVDMKLDEQIETSIASIHPDILMRAAAFLLLKDSKASFAIEGETPPLRRAERWAQAISQAGTNPLSHDEFLRLQEIVIADFRFTHFGYRNEGGFIGLHERSTGLPIPDHISARWQDIVALMEGLIATEALHHNSDIDAVLLATMIAFGFVFIHPLEDGNGRIHRYLIHHILAENKFTTPGIVFPISSVILRYIDRYRNILESFSQPRLQFVNWAPTKKGNLQVLNETIDLYRYFDATKQAEFLYECVKETIETTLPEEVDYLKKYDSMKQFLTNYIELPDKLIDLMIRFLIQNHGNFSKRAREKEFNLLSDEEISTIEKEFSEIFQIK